LTKLFSIKLAKKTYVIGEKVKGVLEFHGKKDTKVPDFSFSVCGEEATKITIGNQTFSASNTIFYEDLSHSLSSTPGCSYENKVILISKEINEIPFEFSVPKDALESYQGKYANISYVVSAKQDKSRLFQRINEKAFFGVGKISQRNELPQRRIVKKEADNGIVLYLEVQTDSLFPGETLNGSLSVNNPNMKKIKSAEIVLKGIEFSIGQEDQEIEIDTGFGISFSRKLKNKKGEEKKEKRTELDKFRIALDWNSSDSVPFEFDLPADLKRSYMGMYSNYSWLLEGIVNIAWSRDPHVEIPIQII
jgi:hypothetical protein